MSVPATEVNPPVATSMPPAAPVATSTEVPPAAPAAPASEAPAEAGSSFTPAEVDTLLADDEGLDEPVEGLATPPPPPAVPPKSEEPSAPVAPVVTPPAVTPPVEPAAPAAVASPPSAPATPPAEAPVAEMTEEERKAQWETWRTEAEAKLVQNYALTKEEADGLAVNPDVVFPKLAARIHMTALQDAMNTVANVLPQMIRLQQAQAAREQELEGQFFGMFPALKEHKQVAMSFIAGYGKANPRQPVESLMKQAGVAAMVHLQLPLEGVPGYVPPAAPQPPATPPFTPAPGGTGSVPPKAQPKNPYTELAEELLSDDAV